MYARQVLTSQSLLEQKVERLLKRLLSLSLFAKVLIANSTLVALGAIAGTYLTTQLVRASPQATQYEVMGLFGGVGLVLSIGLNALILRAAFSPLLQLERTARRVIGGEVDARVRLGLVTDPHTEQVAVSFNAMLDSLRLHTRQLEGYSARLRELSDQVLIAQEDERRRLARELHDETGQELATLLLRLKLFRNEADRLQPDLPVLRTQAAALSERTRRTLDGVRRLALELHPRMMDDLGLSTALRAYVDEWSARTRVPVTYSVALDDAPALPDTTEIAVYRLVQEALVNIAKHANASEVRIHIEARDGALSVEVQDDGCGMARREINRVTVPDADGVQAVWREPDSADETPSVTPRGSSDAHVVPTQSVSPNLNTLSVSGGLSAGIGLFGTQERVALVGGRFSLESAPGKGTTVRAVIPLTERAAAAPKAAP